MTTRGGVGGGERDDTFGSRDTQTTAYFNTALSSMFTWPFHVLHTAYLNSAVRAVRWVNVFSAILVLMRSTSSSGGMCRVCTFLHCMSFASLISFSHYI